MKNLLIFLAFFPCAAFAGPFEGGDLGWYFLVFAFAFSIVVTAPVGLLGGFISSFFTHSRNAGFLWVSVVFAGMVFLLSGKWSVDAGLSGFVLYLFLECFLIYSFLAGWGISGWLGEKIVRSDAGFQLKLTKWLPMSSHLAKRACVRRSMRGVSIQSDDVADLTAESVDLHGLPCGNLEKSSSLPDIGWVATLIPGFIISNMAGVYLWLALGDISVSMCPSDKMWHGASGNTYCEWPLYVFFAKDMIGASVLAVLVILACNAVVPSFGIAAACLAGIMEALVAAWFLFESYNPWKHILSHRVSVGVVFFVMLILSVIAVLLWEAKNRRES